MKHTGKLTLALGAMAMLLACTGLAHAGERSTNENAEGNPKSRYQRTRPPLEVNIYARRRRGGYSYNAFDVIGASGRSPPPYAHVRQTPNGPFDSGFFFDSAIGPHGGDAPYVH
jgi:hypothetical protein